jgi:hypothetical protein
MYFDNFFIESDGRNSIASCPKMRASVIPFSALNCSGNGNGAFSFQETKHGSDGIFRRNYSTMFFCGCRNGKTFASLTSGTGGLPFVKNYLTDY